MRSVACIIDGASPGVAPILITRDRDLGAKSAYPGLSGRWVDRGTSRIFYFRARRPGHWRLLWRELRGGRFDLLYVNSLWAPMSIVPILAVRMGLLRVEQVMVATRGECSTGALSIKARKKRLFIAGWCRLLRGLGVQFHATAELEAVDLRRVFPWAVVRINTDQVDLPPEPVPAAEPPGEQARLVFVGRIAAMKNLALVLAALAGVRCPVALDIYGPIEDVGYWRRCQTLMAALPPTARVAYRGELPPAEVRGVIAGYDALVMPTLGENFGHVIAESLSVSCPVMCSDRTPWTKVLAGGGGWVLPDLTAEALAELIEEFVALPGERRRAARVAAGAAYQRWRRDRSEVNILDEMRLAAGPASRRVETVTRNAG
ncbi:glycosyltransferase [Micromonospora peucetia]|uniref:glycosyltransferase n=1 Tax=Micromonospora peucetia TaxID=47871 RepID=UPI003321FE0A